MEIGQFFEHFTSTVKRMLQKVHYFICMFTKDLFCMGIRLRPHCESSRVQTPSWTPARCGLS